MRIKKDLQPQQPDRVNTHLITKLRNHFARHNSSLRRRDADEVVAVLRGLPMTVWVRPRSNERHGPRIKVCTVPGPRMLPDQTVGLPPTMRVIPPDGLSTDDLHKVEDWIGLNEAAIRAHWEGRISAIKFARRLQRLP